VKSCWKKVVVSAGWFAILAGVTGCGGSHEGSRSSQVVATVNDQEITVMQLNQLVRTSHVREVTPENRRSALQSLTDEALLVQAAIKSNIDRDPQFVQALEQARRRLLVQHFAERAVYPKTPISSDEITEYYRREPLLFSNRREFHLTTFLADQADLTPKVSAELNSVSSVEQLRAVLDAHAIKYATEMVSVQPEQLPIGELPSFDKARVGDVLYSQRSGGKTLLMAVTSIENAVPLSLERARPMIEEYLRNSRNREAAERYLKSARATAKIVYTEAATSDAAKTPAGKPGGALITTDTESSAPLMGDAQASNAPTGLN
jgi:peptidyl-prolyl cis-trans isomerase C